MKKCNFYGRYICIYGRYSYMDVKNSTAVSDRMKEYKVFLACLYSCIFAAWWYKPLIFHI